MAHDIATDETTRLIASDKVEGTAVYNATGERLGSVYNFMVNKRSGQSNMPCCNSAAFSALAATIIRCRGTR
jgi:hypothetical protein